MTKKIFTVRGYQKSGTNWIANILNLHPRVLVRGEYHFHRLYECGINSFLSIPFSSQFEDIVDNNLERSIKRCLFDLRVDLGKKDIEFFGDRSPGPGANLKPIISERYPQIYIIRDGRSVVTSLTYHYMRIINDIGLNKISPWPDLKKIFTNYPELIKKSQKLFKNSKYFEENPEEFFNNEDYVRYISKSWKVYIEENDKIINEAERGLINSDILTIKFEDLFGNVEKMRKLVYEFLALDPREARPLTDREKPGFNKPNNLNHYRKGTVDDWKKYFNDKVYNCFMEEAGDILLKLGYK